jgi:hypothetical protein
MLSFLSICGGTLSSRDTTEESFFPTGKHKTEFLAWLAVTSVLIILYFSEKIFSSYAYRKGLQTFLQK